MESRFLEVFQLLFELQLVLLYIFNLPHHQNLLLRLVLDIILQAPHPPFPSSFSAFFFELIANLDVHHIRDFSIPLVQTLHLQNEIQHSLGVFISGFQLDSVEGISNKRNQEIHHNDQHHQTRYNEHEVLQHVEPFIAKVSHSYHECHLQTFSEALVLPQGTEQEGEGESAVD